MRLAILNDTPTPIWGISAQERIARLAAANGLTLGAADGAAMLANAAFAFDPLWLAHIKARPDTILTSGGVPVLAHVSDPAAAQAVAAAMLADARYENPSLTAYEAEAMPELVNDQLRKRERPFVGRLLPDSKAALERASYAGAYKGATDLLTKYLWPGFAFQLTRLAARIGLSPNQVTGIGFALCVLTGYLFYLGQYWPGMAAGFLFMVLDTVDGKLARCTITSSRWGHILDHGTDLIHPPFWWWAFAMGLGAYGTPLPEKTLWIAFGVILLAYVVQRLIEGAFIGAFQMHIHVWRRFDTHFRLVTARRNPNMAILLLCLAVGRPDWGFLALAWWGALCCAVHLLRLAQAYARRARGAAIVSWLDAG